MFHSTPVSALQFGLAILATLAFGAAVFVQRLRTPRSEGPSSERSRLSIVGIAIQSAAFFVTSAGILRISNPSLSVPSMILSAVVFCTGFGAVLLFDRSARALGANWSLVARTRMEHGLVRHGPFARMRHPIYFAMLLLLLAIGVGFGHAFALIAAIPLFLLGTTIRVREEERLLRRQFGDEYEAYSRATPSFIPWIR
jgi:protein-S-isoprenylcysteine O-methyltransferase Ste14